MDSSWIALLQLGVPLFFILLGMFAGTILEKRHYKSIYIREKQYGTIAVINERRYPTDRSIVETRFVCSSVVVSIDYFKRFLAGLRKLFGGEVKAYVSLVDRGRREAILRIKEQFPDAHLIVNFRIETSSVSQGKGKRMGTVEVMAYGTAIKYQD